LNKLKNQKERSVLLTDMNMGTAKSEYSCASESVTIYRLTIRYAKNIQNASGQQSQVSITPPSKFNNFPRNIYNL
jgi:hypothetical protein